MINTDIQETTIQNAITKSRQDWRTVRFGDVVRNVQVNIEPDKSGLERYVAGEHMETDNLHIRQWGTIGDGYLQRFAERLTSFNARLLGWIGSHSE